LAQIYGWLKSTAGSNLRLAQIYGWLKSTAGSNLRLAQIYLGVLNVPIPIRIGTLWPEVLIKPMFTSEAIVLNINFPRME
ncbi:hypothetical protein KCU98_g16450, partial [Aureobasidium melanogenum]